MAVHCVLRAYVKRCNNINVLSHSNAELFSKATGSSAPKDKMLPVTPEFRTNDLTLIVISEPGRSDLNNCRMDYVFLLNEGHKNASPIKNNDNQMQDKICKCSRGRK